MEKNKVMEEIKEGAMEVCEKTTGGNVVTKLVVGTLCVAAGVGAFIFLKKRRNRKNEIVEEVELIPSEDKPNKK